MKLKGLVLANGYMIKDSTHIIDGLAIVTLDDGTERVYISDLRLKAYPPNDISIEENFADIQDLDAILKWYDVEWEAFCADTGEYRYKEIRHQKYPEQASLHVEFKDGTKQRWVAICDDMGHVEQVTTDAGKVISNLADLRATGIVEAYLANEYDIIDF
ncbi:hypothetical protein F4Z98_05915 [Candidatus Poribacteria bacterium]|nr:hypothetical protein [Candidatus Poribacteria bacterium]MYB01785.1 hypothetical protein [Candidatus Poribacteria bacterium]MYI37338.1 hypothetical protein [Acidimicrobiaceae bacterium]